MNVIQLSDKNIDNHLELCRLCLAHYILERFRQSAIQRDARTVRNHFKVTDLLYANL